MTGVRAAAAADIAAGDATRRDAGVGRGGDARVD